MSCVVREGCHIRVNIWYVIPTLHIKDEVGVWIHQMSCGLTREQLREAFDLWQFHGYTGQMNMGICDLCTGVGAMRRVGRAKTYWVCAACTQRLKIWQTQEMRRKQAAENAQAGAGGGA